MENKKITINQLRQLTDLTQKQFADYFGIPIRTIQGWECGRRKPPDYILKLLERIWKAEHKS